MSLRCCTPYYRTTQNNSDGSLGRWQRLQLDITRNDGRYSVALCTNWGKVTQWSYAPTRVKLLSGLMHQLG